MRLVLDSNIFISSLITVGTPPDLLCRQWRARNFDLITSREQIAEIMRVAGYAKLQKYFTQELAADLLKDLHYFSEVVTCAWRQQAHFFPFYQLSMIEHRVRTLTQTYSKVRRNKG